MQSILFVSTTYGWKFSSTVVPFSTLMTPAGTAAAATTRSTLSIA